MNDPRTAAPGSRVHLPGVLVTETLPSWLVPGAGGAYHFGTTTERIVRMATRSDSVVYRDPVDGNLYLRTVCDVHDQHIYTTKAVDA